jgi:RNA recognition motif-containing protein
VPLHSDNNNNSSSTKGNIPISNSDPKKIKRELYITNFPEGLTPQQITELMNTAMIAINANTKIGNPIISTWMNPDSNYAILEFRSEEEANNAFKLDGLSILGKSIKIGRPQTQYEENFHQQISTIH